MRSQGRLWLGAGAIFRVQEEIRWDGSKTLSSHIYQSTFRFIHAAYSYSIKVLYFKKGKTSLETSDSIALYMRKEAQGC